MTRRVPIFATIVVLLAVATMIALGFWQLGRRLEKEVQLQTFARAQNATAEVRWPDRRSEFEDSFYRRSRVDCARVDGIQPKAGHSADGTTGWSQVADCVLSDGRHADVALGWSEQPRVAQWQGGEVTGVVGPQGQGVKLVADPPQAGLAPLAKPDPRDLPNNHLSYAVQWFLFAATALVIYGLALRRRWRS